MRVWLQANVSSLVLSCAVLGILAVNLADAPAGWSDNCGMELGMRTRRGFLSEKKVSEVHVGASSQLVSSNRGRATSGEGPV